MTGWGGSGGVVSVAEVLEMGEGHDHMETYSITRSLDERPERPGARAKERGTKREEFGRGDWNVSERPQTLLSLPSSLPLFILSSPLSRQADSRS